MSLFGNVGLIGEVVRWSELAVVWSVQTKKAYVVQSGLSVESGQAVSISLDEIKERESKRTL